MTMPVQCIQSLSAFAFQGFGWSKCNLKDPISSTTVELLLFQRFLPPQSRSRLTRRQQVAIAHGALIAVTAFHGLRQPILEGLLCVVKGAWNAVAGERHLAEVAVQALAAAQTAKQVRRVLQSRDGQGRGDFTKNFSKQQFREVIVCRTENQPRKRELPKRELPVTNSPPIISPTMALLYLRLAPYLQQLERLLRIGPGDFSREVFEVLLGMIEFVEQLRLASRPEVVTRALGILLSQEFRCRAEDDRLRPEVTGCPMCFSLAQATLWFADALDATCIRTLSDMKTAVGNVRTCWLQFGYWHASGHASSRSGAGP